MSIFKNFTKRFINGVDIASKSFNLLWKNKKLLIYLAIPIVLGVLVETLAYNIRPDTSAICMSFSQKDAIARILKFETSYNWLRYLSVIITYFLYLAMVTLANISLAKHTYLIYNKKKIGLREIITESMSMAKIKKAIIWTCCILIPIIAFHIINSQIQKSSSLFAKSFYSLIIFSIVASWSLITLFVIQAIAIENSSIKLAIKNSILSVKKVFIEYLGAMFWIVLAGIILAMPFIFLDMFINTLYVLSIPIVLIIYCYISSAYTVSKTLLYIEAKKK